MTQVYTLVVYCSFLLGAYVITNLAWTLLGGDIAAYPSVARLYHLARVAGAFVTIATMLIHMGVGVWAELQYDRMLLQEGDGNDAP
jgi:quinol-cytochrome oxidoreductase complex cytochrome b subunit